jgi:MFS family permease
MKSALWRDRDFLLLQTGRLVSNAGTQATTIAYPLLVLALTHSAAKAGLVGFMRLIPNALCSLPAGIAADRWNRKRLMIVSEVVCAVAIGVLAISLLLDEIHFWVILAVAFVEGSAAVFFSLAATGATKAIVPTSEMPASVSISTARLAAVQLAGPPVGGALFALGRAIPFITDCISYVVSIFSLTLIRTPFQQQRDGDTSRLRTQLAVGFHFLWTNPFIRVTTFLYALGNVTMPAYVLLVIVVGKREGLSGGQIGILVALVGASVLFGSLAAGRFRRAFSVRGIILTELSLGLGAVLFLIWPSIYVLLAAMVALAFSYPITDSVVVGYRYAVTPEHVLGRAESVRANIASLLYPLGPLVAGLLLSVTSPRMTVAAFVTLSAILLAWGVASPAIRNAPSLDELESAEVAAEAALG